MPGPKVLTPANFNKKNRKEKAKTELIQNKQKIITNTTTKNNTQQTKTKKQSPHTPHTEVLFFSKRGTSPSAKKQAHTTPNANKTPRYLNQLPELFTHLVRNGPNPRLQLKALAEASLEVLRAAEALEAASDHDADTLAEGFTLLHAAKTEKKIDTVRHQKND